MANASRRGSNAAIALQGWDANRIRKGSRVIPFLLILVIAVIFSVTRLPTGAVLLADHFERACKVVRKAADSKSADQSAAAQATPVSPAASASVPSAATPEAPARQGTSVHLADQCAQTENTRPEIADLRKSFESIADMNATLEAISVFKSSEIGMKEKGRGLAAMLKLLFDKIFIAFKDHAWSSAATIGTAALYSLLPGIAGAIYRRSFGTWFAISFVLILAITSIGGTLQRFNEERADPTGINALAGGLVVLVMVQLAVLLLASRLRRFTSKPPAITAIMSPRIANGLLAVALWAAAILMGWYGWFNWIWDMIPGIAFFNKWNFLLIGLPLVYSLFKVTVGWRGSKPKNIVVCLDGTNNTPDQLEFGKLAQTNVFKLFRMLKADNAPRHEATFDADICKRYKDKQIAFYYVGVGNRLDNSGIGQILGQATGLGASGIVDRAYLDIMKVYRPGDRICIFGFSRGAAISRLLARAINQRGAPRSAWTLRLFGRHWTVWQSQAKKSGSGKVPIAILGCWDTVGAFGLAKKIAGIDFQKIDLFKDLSVPDNVEQAYHLLALDERRDSFVPTLMEPDPIRPGRIVEVWFSGDHANCGGGWATSKLSDITLDFMLRHISSGYAYDVRTMEPGNESWGLYLTGAARTNLDDLALPREPDTSSAPVLAPAMPQSVGPTGEDASLPLPGSVPAIGSPQAKKTPHLALAEGTVVLDPDVLGQAREWMSSLYSYEARKLPLHAVISDTVFHRMTRSEPIYAPQSLFNLNRDLNERRAAVGDALERLKVTRSLEEWEYDRVLAYRDKLQLKRWSQHWKDLGDDAPRPASRPPVDAADAVAG